MLLPSFLHPSTSVCQPDSPVKAGQQVLIVGDAENGFIYVFDMRMGAILYNSDQSVDLMPLVLKKLGVK